MMKLTLFQVMGFAQLLSLNRLENLFDNWKLCLYFSKKLHKFFHFVKTFDFNIITMLFSPYCFKYLDSFGYKRSIFRFLNLSSNDKLDYKTSDYFSFLECSNPSYRRF